MELDLPLATAFAIDCPGFVVRAGENLQCPGIIIC